jgi:hypothetical protein
MKASGSSAAARFGPEAGAPGEDCGAVADGWALHAASAREAMAARRRIISNAL